MKYKLDENFGATVQLLFQNHGCDFQTVRQEGLVGANDHAVLTAACAEGRILITMDRDFANVLRFPPATTEGIAVILPGRQVSVSLLSTMIEGFLDAAKSNRIRGKLWIIEPGRIREHRTSIDFD